MARGASRTPSRKKTTQRSTPAGSSGLSGWAKGALFVAIGFGIAYFMLGKKESSAPLPPTPPLVTPVQRPATTAAKPATTAQRPAAGAQQTAQPQKKSDEQSFDFYTILPSSEITPTASAPMPHVTQMADPTAARPSPDPAAQAYRPTDTVATAPTRQAPTTSPAPAPSANAAAPKGNSYLLQSLSTSSQEGANALAVRLRDLGLPTQVRAVDLPTGKTTYRVQSGPFPEGAERNRALGLIRVQHLDPMVIRVR